MASQTKNATINLLNMELQEEYSPDHPNSKLLDTVIEMYYYWRCPGCAWVYSDDIDRTNGVCNSCWEFYGCNECKKVGAQKNLEFICIDCEEKSLNE